MSIWETKQCLLHTTTFPLDLIGVITSYLTHIGLFFVEEITPQYSSDISHKKFQSTGVYFSKQEALHHFGNYTFYRRIHSFKTVSFTYRLYVAPLEPNKVLCQRNMNLLVDKTYFHAYDFKTKLRHISKKIKRLPYGKEEYPFAPNAKLLIENERLGGFYYWKYTSYVEHIPEIQEKPIDRVEDEEENGMLQIGWV